MVFNFVVGNLQCSAGHLQRESIAEVSAIRLLVTRQFV